MAWDDLKKGRISIENQIYFITFNTYSRLDIFCDYEIAKTFCQQIKINEQVTNAAWLTWVLMPDHFHGLLQISDVSLNQTISDLKGRSASLLNKQLNIKGQFWQKQYFDHAVRKEENLKDIARYIVANPLRKGLVDKVQDYPFWDSKYL
tara:strand:- start:109 stop:555 length:447 start_codon:yes stop_codon:yes gene_type:complete